MTKPNTPGGPPVEPHVPTIEDVLERCRAAWRALSEFEAAGEQSILKSETLAERVYLDASKAIEGAVTCALAKARAGGDNPARLNFSDGLDKLHKASPTLVPTSWADQLKVRRKRRNQLEHGGGVVPKLAELRATLRDAERFLLEVLHVSPEALGNDPPGQKPEDVEAAPPWPRIFHLLVSPTARAQVLDNAIADGIKKLRQQERHGERLTTTLERDAPSLLCTAARELWSGQLGLGDSLPGYHPVDDYLGMESDLLDDARDGRRIDPERLRLLIRRVGLCEAAGWLSRDEGKLRFADEVLPAMALGRSLVPSPEALAELLVLLTIDPAWGLALQSSASGSDDRAIEWLRLLRKYNDPSNLLSEIMAHGFLLGALPPDTQINDADLAASRDFVFYGLVYFGPRTSDLLAWQLPSRSFWSCALCLASASVTLRERLPEAFGPVPVRLAHLVDTLGLVAALPATEDRDVLATITMPWHALRSRRLSGATCARAQSLYQRMIVSEAHPLVPWSISLIAPHALSFGAFQLLCDLDDGGLGGVMIQTLDCRSIWIEAWSRLLSREPERAKQLWMRVLRDILVPADARSAGEWGEQLLRPVRDLLRGANLEDETRADVRKEILGWNFPDRATISHRRLFKWIELRPDDWTAGLQGWKARSTLSWVLFRECGAPHVVLAAWALHLLAEREALPPELRKGPFGVLTSANVRVTQTGPWKAAFNEARACVEWILDHGDRHAIAELADSALAPPGEHPVFDPPFVKVSKVNLWLKLSQVLWRHVLPRTSGREVLYERIASGKYIGVNALPEFDWQWVIELVSQDESLLASEAPRIFEAYVGYCSVAWHPDKIQHNKPWERPPPNIGVDTHIIMLTLAAEHGVFVLNEWTRVVEQHSGETLRFGFYLANIYATLVALHPEESRVAAVQLSDRVLTAMCVDGAELFWTTWLGGVGLIDFTERLERLSATDFGTGVIRALSEVDATVLLRKLGEPRFFTPFLRATQDPTIYRDPALRKALWEKPREVRELEPLMNESSGPWLVAFLEFSLRWPVAIRTNACLAFACRARDPEVRRRCLACLDSPKVVDPGSL